jgi:hypothetical protein
MIFYVWWRTRSGSGEPSEWNVSQQAYAVELDALIAAGDIVQNSPAGTEYRVLSADKTPR